MASSLNLLKAARKWHRNVSTILFAFFFFISITAVLLGWKNLFASKIFTTNNKQKTAKTTKQWLTIDSLQKLATIDLKNKVTDAGDGKVVNLNAVLDKGYVRFTFKNQYIVQLNAKTGGLISIEKKATDIFLRIHDGEILDDLFNTKGVYKTTYTSLMGLALFFLTLSGFWLRFGQKKRSKKINFYKSNSIKPN
jgi:uncharacterized iron-regulated membrane protein